MIKKKINLIFTAFIVSLLLISLTSAWIIPDTHDIISQKALSQAPNSEVGRIVSENWEDFSACQSLVDYSVFYYFEQGFSSIGKKYLGSHNLNVCLAAVERADKSNEAELACAYGVCAHEIDDSVSHNEFIPMVIENSGLPNGIVHASAEQCINDQMTSPQISSAGKSALVNKYPVHKDFLVEVFKSDSRSATINVENLMDAFVAEVAQNDQYTVGFRGFTAVPIQIHIIFLMVFLINITGLALLIRKKNKGKINKITMAICFVIILAIIGIYGLYFTGNLWRAFQVINKPVCWVLPTSGYETIINHAVEKEVFFFNYGANSIYQILDPAGQTRLTEANQSTYLVTWSIIIILAGLVALLVWLNIRKRRR